MVESSGNKMYEARIAKETKSLLTEQVEGIEVQVNPENYRHFFAKIDGAKDTDYEGGRWNVEVFLPAEYPM